MTDFQHMPMSDLLSYARTGTTGANEELDRRFPVPAPVDRRTLPCFENCEVGDEVEWQSRKGAPWIKGVVAERDDSTVWVEGGRQCAARKSDRLCLGDSRDEIRWPAPAAEAPAFDHEAWVKSLKPGDRYEVRLPSGWHPRTFKRKDDQYLVSEEGGHMPSRECRPLPAIAGAASDPNADLNEIAKAIEEISHALGLATFNPNYTADLRSVVKEIASLKSRMLVIPDEVLKRHPLPWSVSGSAVIDGQGHVVACLYFWQTRSLASAIVSAANGAPR